MKDNKVYFRVDGNTEIGLGHLVRCSALADMLSNNFKQIFYCKEITSNIATTLQQKGIDIVIINNEQEFLEILRPDDIVVLDGYHFDTEYQIQIKAKDCLLICIDDLHDKEFHADIIINHSPGIKPRDYFVKSDTKFALGPDYALLRPKFLEQAAKSKIRTEIETAFVCFGGSDFKNLTEKTLRVLMEANLFKKVNVVTGAAYKFCKDLNDLIYLNNNINYFHNVNEDQMLELMLESDVAIVPASGILFEVLAAGCLPLTSYYVENQKNIFEGFKSTNSVMFIDSFEGLSDSHLQQFFNGARKISRKKIIDGFSGKRILDLIKTLK